MKATTTEDGLLFIEYDEEDCKAWGTAAEPHQGWAKYHPDGRIHSRHTGGGHFAIPLLFNWWLRDRAITDHGRKESGEVAP